MHTSIFKFDIPGICIPQASRFNRWVRFFLNKIDFCKENPIPKLIFFHNAKKNVHDLLSDFLKLYYIKLK